MNVLWKSEDKIIPGFGYAEQGKQIDLPEFLALQYIKQGQAEPVKRGDHKSPRKDDEVRS